MSRPHSLSGVAIHVPICPWRALGLLAWSSAGFWPYTHLGIQLVRLASSLVQSILWGLKVDGGGGIQDSLREERRRSWDWHPNWGGVNLPRDAGGKGCPLVPCPSHSISEVLGALPATWKPDSYWARGPVS